MVDKSFDLFHDLKLMKILEINTLEVASTPTFGKRILQNSLDYTRNVIVP